MLGNDFIDLLGSSHLIPNYEKFFVYENILMKRALFAKFCVIIFVVFFSQFFLFNLVHCCCFHDYQGPCFAIKVIG
jgi:hypothetical protein